MQKEQERRGGETGKGGKGPTRAGREREREREQKLAARHPASKPSCSEGHAAREERAPTPQPGPVHKGEETRAKQWPPRLSGLAPKHPARLEKLALCLGNPDKTLAKKQLIE